MKPATVNFAQDAPAARRTRHHAGCVEVEARKVHPAKNFYSLDQWNHRIGQIVNQYNAEPQQGHVLSGMSPDQAFEAHMNKENPPMQFSAGLRYLLAHDKRRERVTLNGVTIQIGKQKFNYRGREIAHLVGREVLAWFDPENPETIVVTNMDRTNPIYVSRSENPSALESLIAPDSGTLGRELSRIEGQASYMKTRFNVVKAKFPLPQRRLLAAAQALNLGAEIETQKSAIAAHRDQSRRRMATNRNRARRLDIPTVLVGDDEQSRRALELLGDDPRKPADKTEPVIYRLKPYGETQARYADYLLKRLTEFRKAGHSYGQKFNGAVSFSTTRKTIASQLDCDIYDESRFDEICALIKEKIDATILGKNNTAKGVSNYHEYDTEGTGKVQ
jgi:hypothetical protein